MILIEHDGEKMLVESIEGHEGCTVLCDHVDDAPHDHCTLCDDGEWVEDLGAMETAAINRMTNAELVEYIMGRIA